MKISSFDRWVNDNNISDTFEYAKGWWDYIELVRRFAFRLSAEDVRVIGHYVVDTPPPCERLPMPAVAIFATGATFALRYDFGSWSLKHPEIREWVVSVQRSSPYRGPLFGLFDPALDLRLIGVDGLAPDFQIGTWPPLIPGSECPGRHAGAEASRDQPDRRALPLPLARRV